MSFDIQFLNGDIVIGADGDLNLITDEEKVIQDISKILITSLGDNFFHPWYGTTLAEDNIGKNLPKSIRIGTIRESVSDAIEKLISLQSEQAAFQNVSNLERIVGIIRTDVLQDESDPRNFHVFVEVLTASGRDVSTNFTLKIG